MCSMFLPRSSMSTRRPFSVSSLAAHPPEIPDPTTIASYSGFCIKSSLSIGVTSSAVSSQRVELSTGAQEYGRWGTRCSSTQFEASTSASIGRALSLRARRPSDTLLPMEPTDRSTAFGRPGAFWAGVVAVIAGVILHLPMYVQARDMGYRLAGMPFDVGMIAGMVLIVAGLAATIWGLIPRDYPHALASDVHIRVRS